MTTEAAPADRPARPTIGNRLWDTPGAFYLLVFLFTFLSFASPHFLTSANLINIVLQASVILILALGVTLVIITEGIDLSLNHVFAMCDRITVMKTGRNVGTRKIAETDKEGIVRLIMTGGFDPVELAVEGPMTPPGAMASA